MTDLTGSSSWTYNAASQLTQAASPEGTIDYGYDAAGQQTSITLPGSRAVGYGFDPAGQLTSLTDWLNQTVSYGYDANGQQTTLTGQLYRRCGKGSGHRGGNRRKCP